MTAQTLRDEDEEEEEAEDSDLNTELREDHR